MTLVKTLCVAKKVILRWYAARNAALKGRKGLPDTMWRVYGQRKAAMAWGGGREENGDAEQRGWR